MASRPLKGSFQTPADKSLSHRVALFSAMAAGTSRVAGLLDSEDLRSTLGCIEALGAKLDLNVDAGGFFGSITGWGAAGPKNVDGVRLNCGNSGTTARLLMGVLAGAEGAFMLAGDASLSKRPMARVTTPLAQMGVRFEQTASGGDHGSGGGGSSGGGSEGSCGSGDDGGSEGSGGGERGSGNGSSGATNAAAMHLPLTLHGPSALTPINYDSPVASAQVKSAILLAALQANGASSVTEPHKSRDHTELMLPAYGIELNTEGLTVRVLGQQLLRAFDCRVAGDPSSAAFLLVAAAMCPGSVVTAKDLLLNPTRTGFLAVMQRMGADMQISESRAAQLGAERCGSVRVAYRDALTATRVLASEVPSLIDEIPILALLATVANGETVFEQVGELRVKESDRLQAIIVGLKSLGVEAWAQDDDLHIIGQGAGFRPRINFQSRTNSTDPADPVAQAFATHGDHRLAMTWAVAARVFDQELQIQDLDCVSVSYPRFFTDLQGLS